MKMKNASEESQAIHSTKQSTTCYQHKEKEKAEEEEEVEEKMERNKKKKKWWQQWQTTKNVRNFFPGSFSFSNKFILFISLLELNKFGFCVSVISSL